MPKWYARNEVAKKAIRIPLTIMEEKMLRKGYDAIPDRHTNYTINMYLADMAVKNLHKMQQEMNETNQITLNIAHPVGCDSEIFIYCYIPVPDEKQLEKLAAYCGYTRIMMFRYCFVNELYKY